MQAEFQRNGMQIVIGIIGKLRFKKVVKWMLGGGSLPYSFTHFRKSIALAACTA